jgi:hypothetical protein
MGLLNSKKASTAQPGAFRCSINTLVLCLDTLHACLKPVLRVACLGDQSFLRLSATLDHCSICQKRQLGTSEGSKV